MVDAQGQKRSPKPAGFTLVELLVVMAVLATLLSIVAPRYIQSVDLAAESALLTNLKSLRHAIDQHVADTGTYPMTLDKLVSARYIREVPLDPITDKRDGWVLIEHPNKLPGIYDVRSAAPGTAKDGTAYSSW